MQEMRKTINRLYRVNQTLSSKLSAALNVKDLNVSAHAPPLRLRVSNASTEEDDETASTTASDLPFVLNSKGGEFFQDILVEKPVDSDDNDDDDDSLLAIINSSPKTPSTRQIKKVTIVTKGKKKTPQKAKRLRESQRRATVATVPDVGFGSRESKTARRSKKVRQRSAGKVKKKIAKKRK